MSTRRVWLPPLASIAVLLCASAASADDQKKAPPPDNTPLRGPNVPPAPPHPDAPPEGAAAATAPPAAAEAAPPAEVVIQGARQGGDAASRVNVGRRELELRPRLRPGDVLEAVPGLFAVQHAGGGKANQYFLRGFDADHGTDVAFFVDGVPVNNVSHGHGQGYTDFHFLIPELVVGLDGYKGPYYAQFGNFATAGAVNLRLAEKFEESYAQYSVGQYGIMRGLVVASPDVGESWRAVLAAEVYKNDGPFVNPERLKRFNTYARITRDLGPNSKFAMTWMSYGSSWVGSGQIPARAVCGEGEAQNLPPEAYGEKCIDRFGYIDPTEGGATQRHMLSASYHASSHDADVSSMVYAVKYKFRLYSNFTFFDQDPVRGDQIEQNDDRVILGGDVRARRHFHYGPSKFTTSLGLQARHDAIDNNLYHDQRRERLDVRSKAQIAESNVGVYLEEDMQLTPWLRLVAGARADRIDVNVEDARAERPAGEPDASGFRGAVRVSPKLLATVSPLKQLDLFANYGRGYHSNDARGVVLRQGGATLMTPTVGYEVGARFKPTRETFVQADAFLIDVDSELVWSGDEGTTSPAGRTRRYGVELSARHRISNWLFADADLTLVRPRYRENGGNGQAVALAPTRTLAAGFAARPKYGDYTPFFSARLKYLADRPATEDGSLVAQGFTTVDANLGVRWKSIEGGVDVQNLFDATWREVNFATDTRLPYEPATVSGIHYSPGWPRTVIGRVAFYWQ